MSQNEPIQPPAVPYGAPAAPAAPPQYGGPSQYGRPPEKKKPLLARWWFWAIVVVAAIIVIGSASGGNDAGGQPAGDDDVAQEQVADEGTASEAAEEAEEEPAEPEPHGIGDTVVLAGFEITVTSIETGVSSVGDQYLSEDAQGAFVLLGIEVTNTGASAETVLSSSFIVRDADDREFDASSTASIYLGDSGFSFEEINPGNTASGILAFDLPEGTAPQTLEFSPGWFGGENARIALG